MTTPKEFCAEDTTTAFMRELPGKRVEILLGDTVANIMRVTRVDSPLYARERATYQLTGTLEQLADGSDPTREHILVIKPEDRVRVLDSASSTVSPGK